MASGTYLRFVGVIAAVAILGAASAPSTVAQEYVGSTVTVGGSDSPIDIDEIVVLAPGVTISGGDVTNQTGIGVASSGGSSIGAVPGGGLNASIVE